MKFKFLPLGLLALSIVACDSYEESASVEAMRTARTEYVKAETGVLNAEAAYQAARTAAQEISNAYAEASNAVEIDRLKVQLEEAMADLEETKAKLEYTIIQQKQNIVSLENNEISTAYNAYTLAYSDWSVATDDLLDEQNDLVDYNIDLAGAKMTDENWVAQAIASKNADIAGYNATLEELNASLVMYKALEESNDWDAVNDELVAANVEYAEIFAEWNNLDADRNLANDQEDDARQALVDWMSDNSISSTITRGEGVIEMAEDFNAHKATLALDTVAPYNDMTAAKDAVEADGAEDADDYNVLVETYNNSVVVYDEAIEALEAYNEATLKSELAAANSTYVTACNKYDALGEEYAVIYAKYLVLGDKVDDLNALYFTIESNTYGGSASVISALNSKISNTEASIINTQENIDDAEVMLAQYEAGNYTQADNVRYYEELVANSERLIAKYMVEVENAKAWLDAKEAAYEALLN